MNWDSDDNPYKKRFTGLQGKLQATVNELDTLKGSHHDVNERFGKLTGDFEALNVQLTALSTQKSAAEQERDQLKAAHARRDLIIKEFPDLLPFEADNLLPPGTGDDLKTLLTAFRGKLQTQGSQAAVSALQGASPVPPQAAAPASVDDLWKQATTALSEGRLSDYQSLYDQYLKAKAK